MTKYLWSYSVLLTKVVGAGDIDVIIEPAYQQTIKPYLIRTYCSNHARELQIINMLHALLAVRFIGDVTDADFWGNIFVYPPTEHYLASFDLPRFDNLIIQPEDEFFIQYVTCGVGETANISIRAYLSSYDLPTVTHSANITVTTTYQNHIVGVED